MSTPSNPPAPIPINDFESKRTDDPFLLQLDKNTSDLAQLDRRLSRVETDVAAIRDGNKRIEHQNLIIRQRLDDCGCGQAKPRHSAIAQKPPKSESVVPSAPPAKQPLVSYQSNTKAEVHVPEIDFEPDIETQAKSPSRARRWAGRAGWSAGGMLVFCVVLIVLNATGAMQFQTQQEIRVDVNASSSAEAKAISQSGLSLASEGREHQKNGLRGPDPKQPESGGVLTKTEADWVERAIKALEELDRRTGKGGGQ